MRLIFYLVAIVLFYTTPSHSDPSIVALEKVKTLDALIPEVQQAFRFLYAVTDPKDIPTHIRIVMMNDGALIQRNLVQRGVPPDTAVKIVNLLKQNEFQVVLAKYITSVRQNFPSLCLEAYGNSQDVTRRLATLMAAFTTSKAYSTTLLEATTAANAGVVAGKIKAFVSGVASYLPAAAQLYFVGAVLHDVQNPPKSSFKDSLNQGIAIGLFGERGRAEVKRVNPAYQPQTSSSSSSQ